MQQGKSVRRKEQQGLSVIKWPQPPYSTPLHHSKQGGREAEAKLSLRKRERVGGGY